MRRRRSLSLAFTLGLSLAVAGASLVASGCSKKPSEDTAQEDSATKADKPARPKVAGRKGDAPLNRRPPKARPSNPWLDEVLADAEVTVTYHGGEPIPCSWNEARKRHVCPDQEPWVYVGPEVRRVGNHDEYCVWQHPVADGVVTTKMRGLATQRIALRHAFAGRSATVQEAAPVDIVVRVDGEERVKTQRLRKPGFETITLEPVARGKGGNVEIEVSASHPGVAHFCWQIEELKTETATTATANEEKPTAPAAQADQADQADKDAKDAKEASKDADSDEKLQAAQAGEEPALIRRRPTTKSERLKVPESRLRARVPMKDLLEKPRAGEER